MKPGYIWSIATALTLLGAVLVMLSQPHKKVLAQSTTPTFTTSAVATSAGVAIVDQVTGAITYCAADEVINGTSVTPEGTCRQEGRAAVGSGTASLSVAVTASTFYVINNQTGQIYQCPSVNVVTNGVPNPEGACVALAYAAQ